MNDKKREARVNIVSRLYKRGYTYRQIRKEVMTRLDLPAYSLDTVKKDVDYILKEWRANRLESMDEAMELELARIDDIIREAWEEWEKSKQDEVIKTKKSKGIPKAEGQEQDVERIKVMYKEQTERKSERLGDPRYLDLVGKQLEERRKLLGLYAAKDVVIEGKMEFVKPKIIFDEGDEQ